jgi:hypothetical protein
VNTFPKGDSTRVAVSASVMRRIVVQSLVMVVAILAAVPAFAQSGVQVTFDGKRTLISKDVGSDRWAITFNSDDQTVTGNVFRSGGGEPAFVWCGETSNDGNQLVLSCFGADKCPETPCPASDWTFISNVTIPTQFVLPPGVPGTAICPLALVTNGHNAGAATSRWDCHVIGLEHTFSFAVFRDGTGTSSDIGTFSALQGGCTAATIGPFQGETASITNVGGSTASGYLKFHQTGFGLDNDAICGLVSP